MSFDSYGDPFILRSTEHKILILFEDQLPRARNKSLRPPRLCGENNYCCALSLNDLMRSEKSFAQVEQ